MCFYKYCCRNPTCLLLNSLCIFSSSLMEHFTLWSVIDQHGSTLVLLDGNPSMVGVRSVIFMSTAEPGAWQGHVLCWMTFAQNKPVLLLLFPFHHSSFPHTPLDGGHPLRSHAHPFLLLMPVESHIFKEAMLPTPAPMAASPSFLLHSLSAWSWSHRIQPLGPSWLIWCFPGRLEVSCDGTEMSVPSVTHWPLNSLRAWTWSVLFTSAFPA